MADALERRWLRFVPAKRMWEQDYPLERIARVYGLTKKALKTRIQKMRRESNGEWFPQRAGTQLKKKQLEFCRLLAKKLTDDGKERKGFEKVIQRFLWEHDVCVG